MPDDLSVPGASQNLASQIGQLRTKVEQARLPEDLAARVLERLGRIERIGATTQAFDEVDRTADYVDWLVNIPWTKKSADILDLPHTKGVLDKNHYGLEEIKERLLEYIAVIKLNRDKGIPVRAPILCFVGLAGTGKTTVAYSVAEALGRKFFRIALGGLGDVLELRGQSKVHPESEPGRIIKALRKVGVNNPVILLDEIDRVDEKGRAAVMGVLLELLDPEQNQAFLDYYIDYPVDLSEVIFVTTANNTTNIATAVLDRLEIMHMPSYTDNEKIEIGKNYMLPRVLEESGLPREVVQLDDEVWPNIVRPLGYDAGLRTMERTISGIVRKIAKEYVEGKVQQVNLTNQNIKEYLPQY